jgi:hypothetical protein
MIFKSDTEEFIQYLKAHPTERLWQALRNWSGYNFILGSTHFDPNMFADEWMRANKVEIDDTFCKE